jgi:drug/metabolite transporter (DMT)-like permease
MTERRYLPILMTIAAALLWASSFTVVKVGLRYIDPYTFVMFRFLVATVVLLLVVLTTGKWQEFVGCFRDRYALLLGITLAASFGLQFRGQTETTAAKAAMIINSSVVLVAPLSVAFLKERMGSRKLIALVIGLVGVYLITAAKSGNAGASGSLRGDLLIAGSSLSYALYVVFTKMAVSRRSFREVPLITAVFLWSLPIYLAAGIPAFARGIEIHKHVLLATGYLAVFCSVLPFIIWTAAIKHIGALTSAIVLLAELVFGVLIAFVFLRETLPGVVVAGCALICLGILIVGTKP